MGQAWRGRALVARTSPSSSLARPVLSLLPSLLGSLSVVLLSPLTGPLRAHSDPSVVFNSKHLPRLFPRVGGGGGEAAVFLRGTLEPDVTLTPSPPPLKDTCFFLFIGRVRIRQVTSWVLALHLGPGLPRVELTSQAPPGHVGKGSRPRPDF